MERKKTEKIVYKPRNIRMDDKTKQIFEMFASYEGLSLAEFLRKVGIEYAKRNKKAIQSMIDEL